MFLNFLKPSQSPQTKEIFNSALAQAKKTFPQRFEMETRDAEHRRQKFEAISIFMALYAWYLKTEGSKTAGQLSQQAYDHMFDMYEIAMREQGVSDVRVGPEVKKLAAAFHGRLESYTKAFDAGDTAQLAEGFVRNHVCEREKAMGLSIAIISEARQMEKQDLDAWLANLKNLQKSIYEPKEFLAEDAS